MAGVVYAVTGVAAVTIVGAVVGVCCGGCMTNVAAMAGVCVGGIVAGAIMLMRSGSFGRTAGWFP